MNIWNSYYFCDKVDFSRLFWKYRKNLVQVKNTSYWLGPIFLWRPGSCDYALGAPLTYERAMCALDACCNLISYYDLWAKVFHISIAFGSGEEVLEFWWGQWSLAKAHDAIGPIWVMLFSIAYLRLEVMKMFLSFGEGSGASLPHNRSQAYKGCMMQASPTYKSAEEGGVYRHEC